MSVIQFLGASLPSSVQSVVRDATLLFLRAHAWSRVHDISACRGQSNWGRIEGKTLYIVNYAGLI
jgi:hypothetical protein